jgi:hypothetical protein
MFENFSPSTARRGDCHSALSKKTFTAKVPAAMWSSNSQLIANLNRRRWHYGYEGHNFVTGFQNDHVMLIGERRRKSVCERFGHTGTRRKEKLIENRMKDTTFAAWKLMGPDHHRVFMYTPDLSVSNQEVVFRRKSATERCNGLYTLEKRMARVVYLKKSDSKKSSR